MRGGVAIAAIGLAACLARAAPAPDPVTQQMAVQCARLAVRNLGFTHTPVVREVHSGFIIGTDTALDNTFDWLDVTTHVDTTNGAMWASAKPHTEIATPGNPESQPAAVSERAARAARTVRDQCGEPLPARSGAPPARVR